MQGYCGNLYVPVVQLFWQIFSLSSYFSKSLLRGNSFYTGVRDHDIPQDFPKIQLIFPILRAWGITSQRAAFSIYPVKKNKKEGKVEIREKKII